MSAVLKPDLIGVRMDVSQVRSALQHDSEFFIQFFMQDELTFPVPQFHVDIFHEMTHEDVPRYACAIPRDHAKTTLAKLASLWYLLFSDFRFVLYVSNTHSVAVPCVNDIVGFVESSNFISIFGQVEWEIKRDGEGIYKFRIPALDKVCILRAHGAGQQVRGINVTHQRPQLAIVDDLEDVDPKSGNITTEAQFRALKRWFYGSFRKALDKFKHKIIQLGNMLQRMSLLWEHVQSSFWHSRLYGCITSDGRPLWPDAWSLEKLRLDFLEYQEAGLMDLWFAEMMNTPMAPGGGLISADEITYRAHRLPEDIQYGFITVDLAASAQEWSHQTAVAVHGWVEEENLWQVVDYKAWRGIDPIQLFNEITGLMLYWQIWICGIEAVAWQATLAPIYNFLAQQQQLNNLEFVPVPIGTTAKTKRLITWAGMLKSGEDRTPTYALTTGDFTATQQLLVYDPTKKENDDDIIDAIALGVIMMQLHMAAIINQQRGETLRQEVRNTYQCAPV